MDNIIIANFTGDFSTVTTPLWRYDKGLRLQFSGIELPPAYQVHFANDKDGDALIVYGDSDGAEIPYGLLEDGYPVYAWVYETGNGYGRTRYVAKIPVMIKARPTDEEPSPAQQSALDEAINAVNEAAENLQDATERIPSEIESALQEAKESGEFDGEDGYSPTVEVDEITGGHQVTITDKDGPHQFDVMDGEGGGGTSDYSDLTNKPQINSVTLSGNKSLSDLGIAAESSVPLAANVKPKMSGEAAVGSSTKYAREDHVHPIFYPESDEVGWSGEKISHINPNTVTEAVEAVYNVIPTKTSELTNDIGFLTQHQSLAGYATQQWVWQQGYLTQHQSLAAYREATAQDVIDQQQNTAIEAKYTKPSGGIPKTDLASEVQTSLGKADTALQSVPSTYRTAAAQDTIDEAQNREISSKIGYDDKPYTVAMTASGSAVTCFKTFLQIYAIFYSQRKTYFILAASQTDYQLFTIDRVDGGNQTIYLSSIVGGVLSQIVLTPGGSSTMAGTLTTIDLNLQSAQGVSF